jgi:putative glutamine amidotransferase
LNGSSRKTELSRRPVIGITPEELDARGNIILPREYADAVARAGGLPLILPIWQGNPAELLACCHGLILAGGSDVDPALYGEEGHPAIYGVDRVRDDAEVALVHLALAQQMPTLAICRGAQVLNVALGGTLHAHLPDLPGSTIAHRAEPYGGVTHAVALESGTHLARILGAGGGAPVSWHHQAIDRLGTGLRVAAHADDGCVEAVELPDHPWFVGVQWHPELSAGQDAVQQHLFDALVEACRERVLHGVVHH